ncbi:uncharacterized protein LOC111908554 [Lactuca sativa]|uniref:uncharacterized protein LOC111908554 n=1 Tax=Lactuca sativa TaxID=4236 RepID=UPI000CD95586|nr:uncharacterized protein LOC111908554 [Lactuca sativa]
MASFNLNLMTLFSHLLGSSTKIPMLIPEYYDQWVDCLEDYLNGLDEELWSCISRNVNPPANVQPIGSSSGRSVFENQFDRLKKLEKRCVRELRGALPLVVYNYVKSCTTAKEIWNNMNDKCQGSEKKKINSVKQCLVVLKDFRQKEGETIEAYYDHLNELIYRCHRYGITRTSMEFNLLFVIGLRKEWRSVSMMVKNQQCFDTSTLNELYNQLKIHENEVNEIGEESKLSLGGLLALVSKKAKQTEVKGSFVSKAAGEEKKKVEKNDSKVFEGKNEKKLKGDSGVDCYYCNGANHRSNDCMLRKKDERKNLVKDEAYYAEKIEEVRAKTKNLSLIATGEQDEAGTYQI